jgi:DNA uptake protein ComE-like DNA-binding protein
MKELFDIPQSQRKPAIVFLVLILFVLTVRLSLDYFIKPDAGIQVFENIPDAVPIDSLIKTEAYDTKKDSLFFFDPNTVSKEELMKMGLTEKAAGTWIRFREKGFVFRKPEDIGKVYGLKPEKVKKLLPFVRIHSQKKIEKNSYYSKNNDLEKADIFSEKRKEAETKRLDINQADSTAWTDLPMIGPVLSHRIIKYRNLLGGFIHVDQLKEVYGMQEENYNAIRNRIYVDRSFVPEKISLMKDDFRQINKHPYITYEITKKIVWFRKQAQITPENVCLVMEDDALCERIKPYLKWEDE